MSFVVTLYIILLIVFLVASALIFRHTTKFGYLSPRFKTAVTIFGVVALLVILFSIYLLIQLFGTPPSPSYYSPSVTSPGAINF